MPQIRFDQSRGGLTYNTGSFLFSLVLVCIFLGISLIKSCTKFLRLVLRACSDGYMVGDFSSNVLSFLQKNPFDSDAAPHSAPQKKLF